VLAFGWPICSFVAVVLGAKLLKFWVGRGVLFYPLDGFPKA
jgi:hypothetical protein